MAAVMSDGLFGGWEQGDSVIMFREWDTSYAVACETGPETRLDGGQASGTSGLFGVFPASCKASAIGGSLYISIPPSLTYVVKGGSWDSSRDDCRSEKSDVMRDGSKGYANVGFRVVRETL